MSQIAEPITQRFVDRKNPCASQIGTVGHACAFEHLLNGLKYTLKIYMEILDLSRKTKLPINIRTPQMKILNSKTSIASN